MSTNWVVGLVEIRSLRVVSSSGLVDGTNSVLVLVVLHQICDFLSGVSDGAFYHLHKGNGGDISFCFTAKNKVIILSVIGR